MVGRPGGCEATLGGAMNKGTKTLLSIFQTIYLFLNII
jgi:hypothetical protein